MELFLLCCKIFFVRILDVSLGTVRTVLTVKDKIVKASFIGFFEVLVWFIVVKDALNSDTNSLWIAISYALGFATGTYIGGKVSYFFTRGETFSVQLIIKKEYKQIIKRLRDEGYGVSVINVSGNNEDRLLLFMEISVLKLNTLKKIVKEYDKNAFMVVNDTRVVYNGFFSGVAK